MAAIGRLAFSNAIPEARGTPLLKNRGMNQSPRILTKSLWMLGGDMPNAHRNFWPGEVDASQPGGRCGSALPRGIHKPGSF